MAIGYVAQTNNNLAIAIGNNTIASAPNSVALGNSIQVGGTYSVGIGLDNVNRGFNRPNVMVIMGGNVGIGTTNPTNILTIQQGSPTDPIADAWTTYSSKRWKTNIYEIEDALDKVMNLRGVSYDWKVDGRHDIGLIAEEVGEVIPEIVAFEENGIDAKSVDYARIVAVLVQGIKEQQKQIEKQEAAIETLTKRITALEK